MDKPVMRTQLRIHYEEDPVVYNLLRTLNGNARTRRIRQLVRTGIMTEQWLGSASHLDKTKIPVTNAGERASIPDTEHFPTKPSNSASEEDGLLSVAYFIPPTSMGSANDPP